ncbi:hypothetical protein YPPY65_4373, partial [Yersinia pestis PY-65]
MSAQVNSRWDRGG